MPTTSTAGATTTVPEAAHGASTESPSIAVDDVDTSELDGLLLDLDEVLRDLNTVLGDLESSLAQEEGELFND